MEIVRKRYVVQDNVVAVAMWFNALTKFKAKFGINKLVTCNWLE